ncbi:MAG TPA: CPBP family intramembrane glutamic endopeptidase [Rhizomicrobium sp.]
MPTKMHGSERPPVRFWDVLLPLLALMAAAALLVGVMVGVTVYLRQHGSRLDATALQRSVSGVMIAMGGLYLAMLAAIWRVCRKRGPATIAGYFGPFRAGQFVTGAALGVLLAAGVIGLMLWLQNANVVQFNGTQTEVDMLSAHTPGEIALTILVVSLLGPLVEELYFRGLLLAWLRRWLWLPLAALLDAALFALVHGKDLVHPGREGLALTLIIGAIGLLNVAFYLRTRSLWMPFALHMAYNGALFASAYLNF